MPHRLLNFGNFRRQSFKQINGLAFGDEQVVLDTDAYALLADIDTWLTGEYHTWLKRLEFVDAVVSVQSHVVRHPVHQVLALQRLVGVLLLHILGGKQAQLDHLLLHQAMGGFVDFIYGASWTIQFGDFFHHA